MTDSDKPDRFAGLPDFDSFEWEDGGAAAQPQPAPEEEAAESEAAPLDQLEQPDWLANLPKEVPTEPDQPLSEEQPVRPLEGLPDIAPPPPAELQAEVAAPPVADPPDEGRPYDAPPERAAQRGASRHVRQQPPGAARTERPSQAARVLGYEIDPFFVALVLLALSLGLTPLAEYNPIDRYTLLWTALAVAGTYWVVRDETGLRITLKLSDLAMGAGWGLLFGVPLLLVGTGVLQETSSQIFIGLPVGAIFQSVVFVMTVSETLFFRGMLQASRSWLVTAAVASGWSILLFFPTLNLTEFPMLAFIIGTFLIMLNVVYSYVRRRSGLAAAWLCQAIVSSLWLVLPQLLA